MVTLAVLWIIGQMDDDEQGRLVSRSGTSTESVATGGRGGYPGGVALDAREVERWVIEFTNREREQRGLRLLMHDPAISKIARAHSEDMVEHGMTHVINGKDANDRALSAGYDCRADLGDGHFAFGLSENVAEHPRVTRWSGRYSAMDPVIYDKDSEAMAYGLVRGWINSPGHRKNMLEEGIRRIGVGVAISKSMKHGWRNETAFATLNFSMCD